MLAGGLSALILQTLHPQALAGVWDHSNFREDLIGRLRRTTAFVAGTTYAPSEVVDQLIDKVRRIHDKVTGTDQDGVQYRANDPSLLTWVHVTEVYSFLQGYRRYNQAVPQAVADRYYQETQKIAVALGAHDVPDSEYEIESYLQQIQSQLRFTERSRAVLEVLGQIALPVPMAGLSRELFLNAGAALLPAWAQQKLQRSGFSQIQSDIAARTLAGLAPIFRAALHDGVSARSCRRVGVDPRQMRQWPPMK